MGRVRLAGEVPRPAGVDHTADAQPGRLELTFLASPCTRADAGADRLGAQLTSYGRFSGPRFVGGAASSGAAELALTGSYRAGCT